MAAVVLPFPGPVFTMIRPRRTSAMMESPLMISRNIRTPLGHVNGHRRITILAVWNRHGLSKHDHELARPIRRFRFEDSFSAILESQLLRRRSNRGARSWNWLQIPNRSR